VKRHAPATARNREPILEVLRPLLPGGSLVLEIASGTGEHAVFFAGRMPDVTWQPSDVDPESLASIEAHRAEAALPNLRAPLVIDAARGDLGGVGASAVVAVNMIHIAPWAACEGLVRGAAAALPDGGVLFLYGPYRIPGAPFAPSNEAFDASLRARDPAWGVRSLDDVTRLAEAAGLAREAVVAMPANNHSVVFRRRRSP
jgi:cyclopropane fatty-acyl-phospholipid synthase-like methyltransferase